MGTRVTMLAAMQLMTNLVFMSNLAAQSPECEVLPEALRTEVCIELQPHRSSVLVGIEIFDKSGNSLDASPIGGYDPTKRTFSFYHPLQGEQEMNLDTVGKIALVWTPLEQSPIVQMPYSEVSIIRGDQKTITIPVDDLKLTNGKLLLSLEAVKPLPTDGRMLAVNSIEIDRSNERFAVNLQVISVDITYFGGSSNGGTSGMSKDIQ